MPRISRGLADGEIYHVINRGNKRAEVFHEREDYERFITLLQEAKKICDVKIYAFVLMPNHFHLVVEPNKAEDLSKFMQWLLTSYVRFYNKTYKTSGHLWQGRYKSFIVQKDNYLLTLLNYVEQNPQRANLKEWEFVSSEYKDSILMDQLPIDIPDEWDDFVGMLEKERIEKSIERQSPYGEDNWREEICETYDLVSTIRPRGRPKKKNSDKK